MGETVETVETVEMGEMGNNGIFFYPKTAIRIKKNSTFAFFLIKV